MIAAIFAAWVWLAAPVRALAANSTVAGTVTAYSTVQSVGIEWRITGDDNANCVVTVDFQKRGDSAWRGAQPLWRVETGLWHHGEDPGNLLAGSLFFLEPATTYDVRLSLADPDGGAAQQIVSVTTRAEPRAAATARVRYITPGAGGGTGTPTDPFRGFAAADAAAQPGDLFMVQSGTYAGKFTPTHDGAAASPIVYRGANAATVVVDGLGGGNTTSNCVDLTNRRYVFLENMTFTNCLRPVVADSSVGAVIRGCTIMPLQQPLSVRGIVGANVRDLFVADNTILMTGSWELTGRTGAYGTGGYGMVLTGNGIVIGYNRIVESWDAIAVGDGDGTGAHTFNVDIHDNLVDRASDDACQTDAVHQNIRVFRNRFVNCGSAVSSQPCFGGPTYFLYNDIYNTRMDPLKYHQETFYFGAADPQETSGMIAMHNTSICSKGAWYEGGLWHHVLNRNNLFLGARLNLYSLYIPGGQRGDLDYDGYNRQQSTLVKYNAVAFATLPAFFAGAGQEQHGLEVGIDAFVRAAYPVHPEWDWQQGYGAPALPSDVDLQLRPGSVPVDRGTVLANINDGYSGTAPDLGCYELGRPLPQYGPRPEQSLDVAAGRAPDVAAVRLVAPRPNPAMGRVDFALELRAPAAVAVRVVDVAGRTVRNFPDEGVLPGGSHTIHWDGRDDSGAPVRTGIYYVHVRSGSTSLTRKLAFMN